MHYRFRFIMGKPDGPSILSKKEKYAIDAQTLHEEQLLDLENDKIKEEEDIAVVELEEINVVSKQKQN